MNRLNPVVHLSFEATSPIHVTPAPGAFRRGVREKDGWGVGGGGIDDNVLLLRRTCNRLDHEYVAGVIIGCRNSGCRTSGCRNSGCRTSGCRNSGCRTSGCRNSGCRNSDLYPLRRGRVLLIGLSRELHIVNEVFSNNLQLVNQTNHNPIATSYSGGETRQLA